MNSNEYYYMINNNNNIYTNNYNNNNFNCNNFEKSGNFSNYGNSNILGKFSTYNYIKQFRYNNYFYDYNYNYLDHNNYGNERKNNNRRKKKKYVKKKKIKQKERPPSPKKVPDCEYGYLRDWKKKSRKLMKLTLQRRNWVLMRNHFQWFRNNLIYKTRLEIGYNNNNHKLRKAIQSNNLNHIFRNATTMINNISKYINKEKRELRYIFIIMQKLKGAKEFNSNIKYFYKNFIKQEEKLGINKCMTNIEKIWNHKKWRRKNKKNMVRINVKKCINDDLLNNIIFNQINLEKHQIKGFLFNKNKNIDKGELRLKFDNLIKNLVTNYDNNQYGVSQCGRYITFDKLTNYKKFMRLSMKYEFKRNLSEITRGNEYINNQMRYRKLVEKKNDEKRKRIEETSKTAMRNNNNNNKNINTNFSKNKIETQEKRIDNNNNNIISENKDGISQSQYKKPQQQLQDYELDRDEEKEPILITNNNTIEQFETMENNNELQLDASSNCSETVKLLSPSPISPSIETTTTITDELPNIPKKTLLKIFDINNEKHYNWLCNMENGMDKKAFYEKLAALAPTHKAVALNNTKINSDEDELDILGRGFIPAIQDISNDVKYDFYLSIINQIRHLYHEEYETAKEMIENHETISAKAMYEKIFGLDYNNKEKNKTFFKKRSYYKGCARKTDNHAINLLETQLKEFIFNKKNLKNFKDNLTKKQREILKKRKDDNDNVYIEQDKGNRTVKIPRDGNNNFEDKMDKAIKKNNLVEISKKTLKTTTDEITNLLLEYNSELDWKILKYVAPTHYDNFIAPIIKALIKDHKLTALDQKLRVVQPNPGSPTERLDVVIQVIAQYIKRKFCSKNDIKDVFHLCEILDDLNKNGNIDWNSVTIGSLDVDGMYPSYEHNKIIKAYLHQYELLSDDELNDLIGCTPSSEFMEKALNIILSGTITQYDGKYYTSSNGMPQGKCSGPDLVDIAHAFYYDEAIIETFGKKLILYKKFRDDSLVISYIKNEKEFEEYVNKINEIDEKIQFTYEFGVSDGKLFKHGKIMNMLQLTLFVTNHGIDRMIFSKLTNHHLWLHKDSFNADHTFKGIVKGVASVIKRITSDKFCNDCLEYFQALFVKAGYNYEMVINIFNEVRQTSRKALKNKKKHYWKIITDKNTNENNIDNICNDLDNDDNIKFNSIKLTLPFNKRYQHWKNEIINLIIETLHKDKVLKQIIKVSRLKFIFSKGGPTIGQLIYPKSSTTIKRRKNNNEYTNTKSLKKKNNNWKSKWKKDEVLDEIYIYSHLNSNERIKIFNQKFNMIDCNMNYKINNFKYTKHIIEDNKDNKIDNENEEEENNNNNVENEPKIKHIPNLICNENTDESKIKNNNKYKLCFGNVPCSWRLCRYHRKYMIFGNKINTIYSNKEIYINKNLNCNDKNVVYFIICLKCGKIYVGSTEGKFKNRCGQHIYDIGKNEIGCITAAHFNGKCIGENGDPLKYFAFKIVDKIDFHYNFITNDHLLWKLECKWQKKILSFDNGMNDLVDIHSSNGHRRCFKSKLKRLISQLKQDLRMDELIEYLNHEWEKQNKTIDDLKLDKKLMNFMKEKFDKLIFKHNRDYHLVFLHLGMGDTTLAKKNKITKTTAKASHQLIRLESLIKNIETTFHCGICGSMDEPIGYENKNPNGIDWVVCDGPREDDNDSILCNQWYHQECIKGKYKNNEFIWNEKLCFGHNCKHSDWFRNLNDMTKETVIKNIGIARMNKKKKKDKDEKL